MIFHIVRWGSVAYMSLILFSSFRTVIERLCCNNYIFIMILFLIVVIFIFRFKHIAYL